MNRIALDLGIIQIYWYSIFIFLGVLIAAFLILKECKKQKLKQDIIVDLIFYTVIFGLIGARLYYCLFNLEYYLKYPLEIFQIWNGGLAIHGGIIIGVIFIFFYSRKHKLKLLKITDITVIGLIIAQAIGRWGNFFNQEAFGREVTRNYLENLHLPEFIINGMNIDGAYYEPTFLYESMWNLLGFIILLILKRQKKRKVGQLTGFYMIWYGVGRFMIESLRGDSLMLGNIRVAQLVSIFMLVIGVVIVIFSKEKYDERCVKKENV